VSKERKERRRELVALERSFIEDTELRQVVDALQRQPVPGYFDARIVRSSLGPKTWSSTGVVVVQSPPPWSQVRGSIHPEPSPSPSTSDDSSRRLLPPESAPCSTPPIPEKPTDGSKPAAWSLRDQWRTARLELASRYAARGTEYWRARYRELYSGLDTSEGSSSTESTSSTDK
jgi:hypothetical protein